MNSESEPDETAGLSRRSLIALAALGAGGAVFASLLADTKSALASPPWPGNWSSPLANPSPGVNSPFLEGTPGNGSYRPGLYHLGVDLAAGPGQAVYSIGVGVVVYLKTGGPGDIVLIRYTAHDGREFLGVYGHIDKSVVQGQWVGEGDQIGTIHAWASPHLHFGILDGVWDPPRWGTYDLPYTGDKRGFDDPIPFLTAHPKTASGPPIPPPRRPNMTTVFHNVNAGVVTFALAGDGQGSAGWLETTHFPLASSLVVIHHPASHNTSVELDAVTWASWKSKYLGLS